MATKQRNVEKPTQMESLIGVTCINRLFCRWKEKKKTCANFFLASRHSRGKFNFSIFHRLKHNFIYLCTDPPKTHFCRIFFIDLCMTTRIWYASMDLSLHAARVCFRPFHRFDMKIANFGKYHNILFTSMTRHTKHGTFAK